MTSRNLLHCLLDGRDPDSAAFVIPQGPTLTTREWRALVGRLATALAGLGVVEGSRVTFKLSKGVEPVALAHACFQLGATVQPINTDYTDVETRYLVEDVDPHLVVCDPPAQARMATVAGAGRHLETLGPGCSGSLGKLAQGSAPMARVAEVSGDAVAAILYTSGTTGRPKGAQITHDNLAQSARALGATWGLGAADRLLHFLPVYHAHGLLTSIHVMLAAGGSVLFLERFEPQAVLAGLGQATVVMGVPTHYGRLLREPGLAGATGPGFRLAISGSAPLPAEIAQRFFEVTGHRIVERYGSTEAAIVTALPAASPERLGWVGWALPGVQIRVATTEGARAARGIGVLETRGHNVFRGYWRRPDADREAFTEDGWFVTGDIAEIDASGCVRLLGRARDLIISGGLNIYPREVEIALDALPEVAESAVFGVPHPDFGEAGVAALRLHPGAQWQEQRAIESLRAQLAGYKVPKRLLPMADLPRNGNGKVLKAQLRESYRDLFALAAKA
ncbi:MAG TPA: AMP-binding protein [Usitatibacter sp.]|nr:AMP-binding protein [Usitatibacter sp.]